MSTSVAAKAGKWATSTSYPLTAQLSAAIAQKYAPRDQSRTNIVSHTFCDDLLGRLGPSLKTEAHCDIIDVFPGAGLWSSKVHDYLKPRRHLLIEPNLKDYEPFLNPLVQKPDSRYKLLPWNPLELRTYDEIFEEGHLPEQTQQRSEHGPPPRLNKSLLVLANLTYNRDFGIRGYLLSRYMSACLDRTLFHRYGLVRVIAMLPCEDADMVVPKVILKRRKAAFLAEAVSAELTEVATDTSRWSWLPAKGMSALTKIAADVEKRTKNLKIEIPGGREHEPVPLAPQPPLVRGRPVKGVKRPRHDWHHEYIDLEDKLQNRKISRPPRSVPAAELAVNPKWSEYKRLVDLRRRLLYENREAGTLQQAEEMRNEIEAREEALVNAVKNEPSNVKAIDEETRNLRALKREHKQLLGSAGANSQRMSDNHTDERIALIGKQSGTNKPLLVYDQRLHEPFHVDADEFYPREPCSIVDFQPNPDCPILLARQKHIENNTLDAYEAAVRIFNHLTRVCNTHGGKSVERVIRLMFPGRPMRDMIQAVPSLAPFAVPRIIKITDVHGRMTPKWASVVAEDNKSLAPGLLEYDNDCFSSVLLRRVPALVIWDLAVEWQGWPDKPDSETEMFKALGFGDLKELEGKTF